MYKRQFTTIATILSLAALGVSIYLMYPYLTDTSVGLCSAADAETVSGCDTVRLSPYSSLFGIPLPVLGGLFYLSYLAYLRYKPQLRELEGSLQLDIGYAAMSMGFAFSMYLTYLEAYVIHAWCLFCLIQAGLSTALWVWSALHNPATLSVVYKLVRPVLFLAESEWIHETMVKMGKFFASKGPIATWMKEVLWVDDSILQTKLGNDILPAPIGLSAGFDYEGDLIHVVPNLGFTWESVGTVTKRPYAGNPKPRLGRLVKSKSLLVYKGLKNKGAEKIITEMSQVKDGYIGMSVGPTNAEDIKNTQQQIEDMVGCIETLQAHENYKNIKYLELNISCPNLYGVADIANKEALEQLIIAVRKIEPTKELAIKFPIEISKEIAIDLGRTMLQHGVKIAMVGNLAKNRENPLFDKREIEKAPSGNFSGKPTKQKATELIEILYREFKDDLQIVGIGGISNANDAYEKIKKGASSLMLISSLIFEGPTVISDIHRGLAQKLREDGYSSLSEAVGVDIV